MNRKLDNFCLELPKVELHAHLNGSLSVQTMLQLKRLYADSGISDKSDAFFDEFSIGAGDSRNLADCFQVFSIAHALTSTKQSLALATHLTLKEFQENGCCYIELRSTPKKTDYMNCEEYIDTIIQAIIDFSTHNTMVSKLIISIDRRSNVTLAKEIVNHAIEKYKKYPNVVVGVELSGDPTVGNFSDFVPALTEAREAGLKITLHCGEISNPKEVLEMLEFKPDRIGHGTCIHPRCGGSDEAWNLLCQSKIPVEVCLTSNVNTKSCADYNSHHFKELCEAGIPVIICTDDKGVFATSLAQEYLLCAETFKLNEDRLAKLALDASEYIFDEDSKKLLRDTMIQRLNKLLISVYTSFVIDLHKKVNL